MHKLPKLDTILSLDIFKNHFKPVLAQIAKEILNEALFSGDADLIAKIASKYDEFALLEHKKLINATGIIIHTNLGRAPVATQAWQKVGELVSGYCNLELNDMRRGDRYALTSALLAYLSGCEDALIVNNNAAAVFLVLNTFAGDGASVAVSRGELVEIGGSFRVPEVMSLSGARLKEVGTTNRTSLEDYENAIKSGDGVKMLLKVHKSNYEISGFTSEVEASQIAHIARENGVLSYFDLGSGFVGKLPWSSSELNIKKAVQSGVDIISFSGDKLFGGPQCGVILASSKLINIIKQNQLLRIVRPDKITLLLLNETIKAYLEKNYSQIPILSQLWASQKELEKRALTLLKMAFGGLSGDGYEIIKTDSFVGGGAMPNKKIPSIALAISGNADELKRKFYQKGVIGRVANGRFLLDFRAVLKSDLEPLATALREVCG